MGLTKEQLRQRSKEKLYEYLNAHSTEVKHSKIVKKIWDKYPICAQDICVLHALITKDGNLMFTDYDVERDTYPEKFCRMGDQLEREYLDSIYQQVSSYDSKHM